MKNLDREQVILWAYEAGFPTNYVRGEARRFETLAHLVQMYVIDKVKEEENGSRNSED